MANTEITVEGAVLRSEAGALWDDVVVTSLAYGLGGLECLSGIPGPLRQELGPHGFNLMFPSLPEDWLQFCTQVVPELQRRGLAQTEYRGDTLRERLGLKKPPNQFHAS